MPRTRPAIGNPGWGWDHSSEEEVFGIDRDRFPRMVTAFACYEGFKLITMGGVYRAVPVPPALLDMLDLVHAIRETQRRSDAHAMGNVYGQG